jgi:hypothetical protein
VNYVWIEQELQSFVDAIDSYSGRLVNGQGQIAVPSVTEEELLQRSAAMKEVVDAVAPGKAWQLAMRGYTYTFDHVREAALEALGIVRARDDFEKNLTTAAPKLADDGFHPWVWLAAASLWDTGHHRAAVQAAATSVDLHLQALVGRRDVTGTALAREALGAEAPVPSQPRLQVPGDRNAKSWKSRQAGWRDFAAGCFEAVRKPRHSRARGVGGSGGACTTGRTVAAGAMAERLRARNGLTRRLRDSHNCGYLGPFDVATRRAPRVRHQAGAALCLAGVRHQRVSHRRLLVLGDHRRPKSRLAREPRWASAVEDHADERVAIDGLIYPVESQNGAVGVSHIYDRLVLAGVLHRRAHHPQSPAPLAHSNDGVPVNHVQCHDIEAIKDRLPRAVLT